MTDSRHASLADNWGMHLRSAIRGRERWDVKAIKRRPDLAQELEKALMRYAGVLEVEANPISGRVLVKYYPETPGLDVESAIRHCLEELSSLEIASAPSAKNSLALYRVLKTSLPEQKQLAAPVLLSTLGHTIHILQGLSFVATINTARGKAPELLQEAGLNKSSSRLTFMTALTMLLTSADVWLQYHRSKSWRKLAQTTQRNLRAELFAHIEKQDLEFFDRNSTGQLINLVAEDTAVLGEFVERAGDQVIEKSLTIIVAGILLLAASPMLALLACLPLPFLLLPSRMFGRKTAARYAEMGQVSGQFSQMLENSLSGISIVKSFTAEQQEIERLGECDSHLAEATLEATSLSSLQSHLAQGIFSVGFSAIAGIGGSLAIGNKISQDEFTRAMYWFPQLLSAFTGIEQITRLYHGASNSAIRVTEVLDFEPSIRSGPRRLPTTSVRGEVVFEDVSFGYDPSVEVLENISLTLRPGETLGIVGPTGSGKSTLLRLLMRFYDASLGRILLDGTDIRELDLTDLRMAISLVSQEVYLFQGTVRENVLYGQPHASEQQVVEALAEAGAMDFIESLPGGLDAEVGERGRKLSGGERQRVAIARALLKGAPILALDEATSHLDYETEFAVKRSLRKAASGKTVIMIAHRLSTIRNADRILVLQRGQIIEIGSHEELVRRGGLYASLWQLQSGEDRRR